MSDADYRAYKRAQELLKEKVLTITELRMQILELQMQNAELKGKLEVAAR